MSLKPKHETVSKKCVNPGTYRSPNYTLINTLMARAVANEGLTILQNAKINEKIVRRVLDVKFIPVNGTLDTR